MICPVCGTQNDKEKCISCGMALLKREIISLDDIDGYINSVEEEKKKRSNDFVIEDNVLIKYNGTDSIVQIPEGVEVIADKCFTRAKNDNMKVIIMPNSLKKINSDSCRNSNNPSNNGAFEMCESIEQIVFKEGSQINEIGNYAFYMCENLQKIEGLEGKKVYIGNRAFSGCDKKLIKSIGALKDAEFADVWS